MNGKRLDCSVILLININISILPVLIKNTPHQIFQVDSFVVIEVLLFYFLVRAYQPVFVRCRKRSVNFFDNASINGVSINKVIAQLEQLIYILLLVAENGVVIKCCQISRISNVSIVEGNRYIVAFSPDDCCPFANWHRRRRNILFIVSAKYIKKSQRFLTSLKIYKPNKNNSTYVY